MVGSIFSLGSVPGKSVQAGGFEAGFAGLADGFAAAGVFVVGGDVADTGVQPDGVGVGLDDGQLGPQGGGVGDRQQVWPLGLDGGR